MMRKKRRKIIIIVLLVLFLPSVGIFMLNLLRTNRLERYLRRELVRRTALATDGFYKLSFDKLNINLFNGELNIKGIRLVPNPRVFQEWEKKDSLPFTYVDAQIGMIGFKGVNMTWRKSFRLLHFNSFEIRKPEIHFYDSYYSSRTERLQKEVKTKTLYEMIAPYIDVLTVKKLNLNHADVSYTVVNPVSPIIYALHDVSFHAYGFRLDKNSSQSGKLLYCNDFDFNTNKAQTLLTNNDFVLNADRIRLDTKDSIIYISKIDLASQKQLWRAKRQKRVNTLDTFVDAVTVRGIKFSRKNALNYLTARSFDIVSPSINAFHLMSPPSDENVQNNKRRRIEKMSRDSLVNSLSLYEIISPVLHDVVIHHIGIANAKMQYLLSIKDSLEVYKLGNFDFKATDFHIDSLAKHKRGLWYSRSFAFEAKNISGRMTARNHQFNIKRLALDTEKGDFVIDDIALTPLAKNTHNDYIKGHVAALEISGLKYSHGISADMFLVKHPVIGYVTTEGATVKSRRVRTSYNRHSDVYEMLDPFLRYLSVNRFILDDAEVSFNDRRSTDATKYQLKHFNFFANDILYSAQTERQNDLHFDYEEMGFDFSHFDNYLPGKMYRLKMEHCSFSTLKGILSMQGICLIPQDTTFLHSNLSIQASSPSLLVSGLKRLPDKPAKNLYFSTLLLSQPQLDILKKDGSRLSLKLTRVTADDVAWDSTAFRLNTIALVSPIVNAYTVQHKEPLRHSGKTLPMAVPPALYDALSAISGQISLRKFILSDAIVSYAVHDADGHTIRHALDTTNVSVEGLAVNNVKRELDWDKIRFDTQNLAFPLDNGFYTLRVGRVGLVNNNVNLNDLHLESAYSKEEFAYHHPKHSDWFDLKVGKLSLSKIDVMAYLRNKSLRIDEVDVKDATLKNLKNQKIVVQHHVVPMIYAGLQKAPLQVDIRKVGFNNFAVVYEELAKKGTVPGKLYLTGINGLLTGLTNHPSSKNQYMGFDATGKLMDKGRFEFLWQMPLDSTNDHFHLNIHISAFDMSVMNELITPLASAEILSGHLNDMAFSTDASSKGATAQMQLLYNDLRVSLLKNKNGEMMDNKLLSGLVNKIVKHDNPEIKGKKQIVQVPRQANITIVRDPYHSIFNYMWQILRPALIESVGVSQVKQERAMKVVTFINKVKGFFHKKHSETQK
jgi:hypothetical protein